MATKRLPTGVVHTIEDPRIPKGKPPSKRKIPQPPIDILMDGTLTLQQEAYARGRALGLGMNEAALLSGTNVAAHGKKWEQLPAVKARITELARQVTSNSILKYGLNQGWVISRLMANVERCMTAEPVLDREGQPIGVYKFDSGGANKALELLGRRLKMWSDKETEEDNVLSSLSDDELERITLQLAAETGLVSDVTPKTPKKGD